MPTLLETASELDNLLNIGWADATPIAIDNIQFEETQDQAYLSTKFIPYFTENVNINASEQKRKRTRGVLFINIRTPLGDGIGLAYQYANDIQEIMDNRNPVSNLLTEASTINRVGDDKDGWFNLICEVPFISDEI